MVVPCRVSQCNRRYLVIGNSMVVPREVSKYKQWVWCVSLLCVDVNSGCRVCQCCDVNSVWCFINVQFQTIGAHPLVLF